MAVPIRSLHHKRSVCVRLYLVPQNVRIIGLKVYIIQMEFEHLDEIRKAQ